MAVLEDDILRVIVVFCPFCNILFSKDGTTKTRSDILKSSRVSSRAEHWVQEFFITLRTPNAAPIISPVPIDDSFGRPLEDCVHFQFCGHVHNIEFVELPLKSSVLMVKNALAGADLNVYTTDYTNMLKRGHPLVTGRKSLECMREYDDEPDSDDDDDDESVESLENKYDEDTWKEIAEDTTASNSAEKKKKKKTNEQKRKLNRKFKLEMLMLLSRAGSDEEKRYRTKCVKEALHYMKHDAFGNLLRSGVANYRYRSFINSDFLRGRSLDLFKKVRDEDKPNNGNTKSHHSTSTEDMKEMDAILQPLVSSGKKFIVQADGTAKKSNPTNIDGTSFITPQDNTLILAQKGSNEPHVLFRLENFVPGITVRGLENRCRGMNGDGNTKMRHTVKFEDYQIDVTQGIVKYVSRKFEYMNEQRVAEVQFVKRSDTRARTANSLLAEFAAKSNQINSNDDALVHGCFIMCAGRADMNNPKKYREENTDSDLVDFELPDDGADLGVYQVNHDDSKDNSEMRRIRFDRKRFIPITWSGLDTRLKNKNDPLHEKKIRRVHQGRPSKNLDLSQGMIVFEKGSSTKIETWIEANLVFIWFLDKPGKKQAAKTTTKAKKGGKKGNKK